MSIEIEAHVHINMTCDCGRSWHIEDDDSLAISTAISKAERESVRSGVTANLESLIHVRNRDRSES